MARRDVIIFNASKKEVFTASSGYKTFQARLRTNWKIQSLKEEITEERLAGVKVWITCGPREKFTAAELEGLKRFMEGGGSVLVMMGEGGEHQHHTNINFFLEEFGIMVNNDAVVRTVYYKYFHPKEALVPNGVLNREVNRALGKGGKSAGDEDYGTSISRALNFLYPFGATLSVVKPAMAILSTGSVCFPVNRPVLAFFHSKKHGGKLAVLGSYQMFCDQYIDKEENGKVVEMLMQWLTTDEIHMNQIDAENPEISDYHTLPDTGHMAEDFRVYLQENEEIPQDITSLFVIKHFQFDNESLPSVVKACEELRVKYEALELIQPQFEVPLPPLQPAVFPLAFREVDPPPLEMYDLDEAFSSKKAHLAQLTNKCSDADLDLYVRRCGDILGVSNEIPPDTRDSRHVLEHIFLQLIEFKKLNRELRMNTPDESLRFDLD
uniref:intraflagellar transport protein 52 homolog isoform X1 n=2 Tax=Myxine glutinosa TaxID=7769 RepID=UPI00358DF426